MVTLPETSVEQRFLIRNVSWRTYETFLKELGNRAVRLTYDRGNLEFTSPNRPHEHFKRLLGRLIEMLTFELNIPISSGGSTTFKREDLERGLEPDECYWIANERLVRAGLEIDLQVDPPPDLAIEIDISSSSLNRQAIYGALGVPEIWRFDGESLRILVRQSDGQYVPSEFSAAFPFLRGIDLLPFLKPDDSADETSRLRAFVAWIRERLRPGTSQSV